MHILEQCFRVYIEAERFEEMIAFYEGLQGVPCARRAISTSATFTPSVGRPVIRRNTAMWIRAAAAAH